jgi:motility quorum-sensing regulator/GCU-specific mRNA interferase toxin
VTEKKKPTYDLEAFQSQCSDVAGLNATTTAIRNGFALGFTRQGMVDIIQTMHREHFYKSMTSYADYKIWQDVYHVPSAVGVLYVKFTADTISDFLLLSFKEKDNG